MRPAAPPAPGRWLVPAPGERLAPTLTGLLLVLSFPPFSLPGATFIALVPFLVFVRALPAGDDGRWRATRAGYLMGTVHFGLLLYWLLVALLPRTPLAVPVYLLTVLVLAGLTATFARALHFCRERTPVPAALAAAVLWTTIEWVQSHLGDLSFPWLGLGTSLAPYPRVAGAADLVGASGLSFWVALVNGLLADVVVAFREGRPIRRTLAATVAVVAIPIAYGAWRFATLEPRPAARVAVVQTNIPADLRVRRAEAVDSTLSVLRTLMASVPAGAVDLVVWPEVTLPTTLADAYHGAVREAVREMSARAGAPIVVGAYGTERTQAVLRRMRRARADEAEDAAAGDARATEHGTAGAREAPRAGVAKNAGGRVATGPTATEPVAYNSAFLVTPAGFTGDVYHKRHLVPFVERVPFLDVLRRVPPFGDLRYYGGLGRGDGAPVFATGDARFGILICFESIFAGHARAFRRAGAEFLLNATNDGWYGRDTWYGRTTALWQHPAHLSMRAIELRVGVARAANTGFSLFVDPRGRVYERTALFVPGVRIATVFTTDTVTVFARWGDWLATAAAAASLVMLLAARLGGRLAGVPRRRPLRRSRSPRAGARATHR